MTSTISMAISLSASYVVKDSLICGTHFIQWLEKHIILQRIWGWTIFMDMGKKYVLNCQWRENYKSSCYSELKSSACASSFSDLFSKCHCFILYNAEKLKLYNCRYTWQKKNTLIHFNLAEGMIEAIVHMLAKTRKAGCKECWDLFLHIPFVLPLRNLFYALRLWYVKTNPSRGPKTFV